VSNSAQKRAIENHRSGLTKRGIVRFELQALEADRGLIRRLARKLTEEGWELRNSGARCNKLFLVSPVAS
jgi:hypothetical protein